MASVLVDKPAPDFKLENYQGDLISLSDYKGKRNVLIVLNRGFA